MPKLAIIENNVLQHLNATILLQKAFASGKSKVGDVKRLVLDSLLIDGAAEIANISL